MGKKRQMRKINRAPKKKGRGRRRWAKIKAILKGIAPYVPTVGPVIAGMLGADKTFAKISVLYEEVQDLRYLENKIRNAGLKYKKHKKDKTFRQIKGSFLTLSGDDVLQLVQVLDAIKALKSKN